MVSRSRSTICGRSRSRPDWGSKLIARSPKDRRSRSRGGYWLNLGQLLTGLAGSSRGNDLGILNRDGVRTDVVTELREFGGDSTTARVRSARIMPLDQFHDFRRKAFGRAVLSIVLRGQCRQNAGMVRARWQRQAALPLKDRTCSGCTCPLRSPSRLGTPRRGAREADNDQVHSRHPRGKIRTSH